MSALTPQMPAQTHVSISRKSIDEQPAPVQTMSVRPTPEKKEGESQQGAMRLRGGCIPCPVRITCPDFRRVVAADCKRRMADAASSYRYRAVEHDPRAPTYFTNTLSFKHDDSDQKM
ncbi:unnamed protein product [Cyclocybe aegerita]|uniref:Uncharacterized protein n=1 Tax=Cyclocybe aegerita TaxID=1973307 RepID=A0A8S0X0V9_CYCAE|nr:unnamed protein product [Cyclocybe aegerita]